MRVLPWFVLLALIGGWCALGAPASAAAPASVEARRDAVLVNPPSGPPGTVVEISTDYETCAFAGEGTRDGSGAPAPQLSWRLPGGPVQELTASSVTIPEGAAGQVEFIASCPAGWAPLTVVSTFTITAPEPMTIASATGRAEAGATTVFDVSGIRCDFNDTGAPAGAGGQIRIVFGGSGQLFTLSGASGQVTAQVPGTPGPSTVSVECALDADFTSEQIPFVIDTSKTGGPPTGPQETPTLTLSPTAARPGGTVRLVLSGFPACDEYAATLDGAPLTLRPGPVFTVPKKTSPGAHTVRLTCVTQVTALSGRPVRLVASADVVRSARLTVLRPDETTPPDESGTSGLPAVPAAGTRALEVDLRGLAGAVSAAVIVTLAFLTARALALRDQLIPRKHRFPLLGFPAEFFNKALEKLNERRKTEEPRHPWVHFLGGVAFAATVQAFANADARTPSGALSAHGFAVLLAAFAGAVTLTVLTYAGVGHLVETRDLIGPFGKYRTLWTGLAVACVMSVVSYLLRLNPGYVFGLIGYFTIAEWRGQATQERKLQAIVCAAWTTFLVALICCGVWMVASDSYDLALKTLTVTVLETGMLALIPAPLLDGGELLQNRPAAWLATFPPMLTVWLYLAWSTAESSPWATLLKMTAVMLAVAVLSYPLWNHARAKAAREAAALHPRLSSP
ncbi:hypothetical protein ABGB12_08655 [Actinocorallia sp. B10E7]|uniref:hypothetical protein n=1 Tax=Actinocorallia sp. B10E7 TaxID=3153558 RepID=UPI00325D06F2